MAYAIKVTRRYNMRCLMVPVVALALVALISGCAQLREARDWAETGAKAKVARVETEAHVLKAKAKATAAAAKSKAEGLAAVKAFRARLERAKPKPVASPVAPAVVPAPVAPPPPPAAAPEPPAQPPAPAKPVADPLMELYRKLSAPK